MKPTTVIHHSSDYDGVFCREIARKFMPDAELIGWDFSDAPITVPPGQIYVLDLPCDKPFGLDFRKSEGRMAIDFDRLVWIDHHKSAIDSHPAEIPGYRIDGVAASRLAWQWFTHQAAGLDPHFNQLDPSLPTKDDYLSRIVLEPRAVRLAGEYDIWDHRGDGDLEFQFGLDAQSALDWSMLLSENTGYTDHIILEGRAAMQCYKKRDADIMRERSFLVDWEGLKFLAITTARCNSNTFAARDVPETGHDALMGFFYNGRAWIISLYHAAHRKDLDLSAIAVKYGGGGHRGACGMSVKTLPFIQQ